MYVEYNLDIHLIDFRFQYFWIFAGWETGFRLVMNNFTERAEVYLGWLGRIFLSWHGGIFLYTTVWVIRKECA